MISPGKRDYYNFGYMRSIASRFRRAVKKVAKKLYIGTWMNSLPPGLDRTLRNYGDVVVELKKEFQRHTDWKMMKVTLATTIRQFEKEYPGLSFTFTTDGNHDVVIALNARRYQYPVDDGTGFTCHVDPMATWF